MAAKPGTAAYAAKKNGAKPKVNPEIVVDLSGWYMDEFIRWTEAGASRGVEGITALNDLMATAIRAWPFAGDPSAAADYRTRLKPFEWKEAVEAVEAATASAFQRPDERGDQSAEIQPLGSRAAGPVGADDAGAVDPDAETDR